MPGVILHFKGRIYNRGTENDSRSTRTGSMHEPAIRQYINVSLMGRYVHQESCLFHALGVSLLSATIVNK